ncbi:MAG: phosphoribosylamine--glycine ligase [Deltaproteobacteria bacterium]|nr:phosphoribosylamine--glycine ligase [Deltaproteobacteria bacterium]
MKVMIIGSGAREHVLAAAVSRSPRVSGVICAPGNAGTLSFAQSVAVNADDVAAVVKAAKSLAVDFVVVGPEAPLVNGVVDALQAEGISAFGPCRAGALIEGSKVFAKRFMAEFGIATADFEVFDDPDKAELYIRGKSRPLVVKADGLAAGKGVIVTSNAEQAVAAIDRIMRQREFGDAGNQVVVEERLVGQEISYHIVSDGERFIPLAASQDHKQVFDGDRGPNTGGMGAYSPPPVVTAEVENTIRERVVKPTLEGFRRRGITYRGALFIGLMMVDGEPVVLEYNARLGDPETQVLIPRWKGDLMDLLLGSARGDLADGQPAWDAPAAICVVLASEGYPGAYPKGRAIRGIEQAASLAGVDVYHAGTTTKGDALVTSGGRVLSVVARGEDIDAVAEKAYAAVSLISFEGMHFRRDIAWRARREYK